MKTISSLRWVHRWLGIFLCFTLINISLTGTLLIWKKEYLWFSFPDARQTVSQDPQQLATAIEAISRYHAEQQILLIQIHPEDLALHKVFLEEGRAWHNQNGEVLDEWRDNGRFEDWLVDLHHRFLLGNDIGLNIAGFSGLFVLLSAILGLTIWLPRRRTFKLGIVPKNMTKGSLQISHGNLGFLSFLPILLIAITGVILTYPDEARKFLLDPFSNNDDYLLSEGPLDTLQGSQYASWASILERAVGQYPSSTIRWVTPESFFSYHRVVGLQQSEGWNSSGQTTVYIDSQEGYMDVNINALKRPKVERLYDFVLPLHTAKIGIWYRLLLTLAGLAFFSICLFGLIAFFKKRPA